MSGGGKKGYDECGEPVRMGHGDRRAHPSMEVGSVKVLMVYTNTDRMFAPAPLGA